MNAIKVKCRTCGAAPGQDCVEHVSTDLVSMRVGAAFNKRAQSLRNQARPRVPHDSRVADAARERG